MKISVIIPTMNRSSDLRLALDTLLGQTYKPFEVLVIDQSLDDKTRVLITEKKAVVQEKQINLEYVFQEEKSSVKARNRGIEMALGDIVSFLDDDIELFEDYFEKVVRYFKEDASLGALSGNTLIKNKLGGWKWSLRKILLNIFLLNDFKGNMTASGFGYPVYEREIDRVMSVEMLPGCNMNMRAGCIPDLRFDEWFTGYSYREDVELSYRVSLKAKVLMVPDAKLYHHYSLSNRMDVENLKKMEIRNYHHVFKKFKYRNIFSSILFFYSLFGNVLMDLIEFASTGQEKKLRKFRAGVSAAFSLMGQGS